MEWGRHQTFSEIAVFAQRSSGGGRRLTSPTEPLLREPQASRTRSLLPMTRWNDSRPGRRLDRRRIVVCARTRRACAHGPRHVHDTIAQTLVVSSRTLETHIRKVYRKLDLPDDERR